MVTAFSRSHRLHRFFSSKTMRNNTLQMMFCGASPDSLSESKSVRSTSGRLLPKGRKKSVESVRQKNNVMI